VQRQLLIENRKRTRREPRPGFIKRQATQGHLEDAHAWSHAVPGRDLEPEQRRGAKHEHCSYHECCHFRGC
jgi:hypothetical protein